MRRTLILLLAVCVLVLGAGTALAKSPGADSGGPFRLQGFALTEEQAGRIQEARESFWSQVEAIRERVRQICTGDNAGAAADEVHQLREDFRVEIMEILTPEQAGEMETRVGRQPRQRRGQ